MSIVNTHEAKTHLSKLVEKAQRGEEIIIAKAGQPVAKLIAYTPPKQKIAPPGAMKGDIWVSPSFDDPVDELFEALQKGGAKR